MIVAVKDTTAEPPEEDIIEEAIAKLGKIQWNFREENGDNYE